LESAAAKARVRAAKTPPSTGAKAIRFEVDPAVASRQILKN